MVLARKDFTGVVRNAVAGLGFAPDVAMVDFPIDLFLAGSDIGAVERDFDKFIHGLTKWQQPEQKKAAEKLPRIKISGANPAELHRNFNTLFLKNHWGDGLPLVPPTDDCVEWILQGTDALPQTELGKFMPRGGIVTIETVAVALAMAGGRPEYLPILIAAIEAIFDPALKHEGWQATSGSTFPVVILNGPAGRQVRVNAGFGLVGPDPRHPAGASIGRAMRLLQQNVGGALPGIGTMSMYGGMRYTNAVFAEDEEGLPEGWQPFNTERMGYAVNTNSVTVNVVSGANNILRRGIGTEKPQDEAVASLLRVASYMKSYNAGCFLSHAKGTPGILIMSRPIAKQLAGLGWTKKSIREFLWEHTHIPLAELEKTKLISWMERTGVKKPFADPWPITSKPENIAIVIAGGAHPSHAYWMQTSLVSTMTGATIRLPAKWDELLARAREELGDPAGQ